MADWALCSMALFRGDLDAASEFLAKASPSSADPNEVLDPDGPLPYPEGWKRAFFEGTIRLLGGVEGAEIQLMEAERLRPTQKGPTIWVWRCTERVGRTTAWPNLPWRAVDRPDIGMRSSISAQKTRVS